MSLLIRWIAGTLALLGVAYLLPGVVVDSFTTALIAAVVLGLINAVLGRVLKFISKPLTCLTLGLFALVINAVLFWLASEIVPGFEVVGLWGAVLGSLIYGLAAGAITAILGGND